MHLNLLVSLLFTSLSLHTTSLALPFIAGRKESPMPLAPRATYSVVPIDGSTDGSSTTQASGTTIQTVLVTPTPSTKTVTESSPPATDTIIITANPTTRTVATTVSVVDIQSTTNVVATTVTDDGDSSSTISFSTMEPTITPTTALSTTSTTGSSSTSPTLSSTIGTLAPLPTETPPQYTSFNTASTTTVETTSVPIPSSSWSSSASYDDGLWHTTYPPWNATVTRRFARES
ncbi:hypothetical protein GGR54DRAFT_585866 [Hypoxylon sp. NC1633]|nr:hypothetical protein GGR54DRAFT_585866 [Hypoxylon sp. NC1633]